MRRRSVGEGVGYLAPQSTARFSFLKSSKSPSRNSGSKSKFPILPLQRKLFGACSSLGQIAPSGQAASSAARSGGSNPNAGLPSPSRNPSTSSGSPSHLGSGNHLSSPMLFRYRASL